MPQFDFLRFPPQLFWLAVLFFVFVVLMYTVAVPTLRGTIARRQETLDADLGRAAKLKAEIDIVVHAYERALTEARHEAQATLNAAHDKLTAIATERQNAAKAAINREIEAAEARIAAAKTTALGELRGIAIEAASAAASRLLGSGADPDRIAAAVDDSLKRHA
jgi:F-type H+-transporting ATPase subunit b